VLVNRGTAHKNKGEYDRAIQDFTEAFRIEPQYVAAYNLLAWLWATCPDARFRDAKKALQYAQTACGLKKWHDPECLGTLAAAHAANGQFQEAVKWQKQALETGQLSGEDLEAARQRLRLYEAGQPYVDK
jgi:tetratricopeptide (TPR) repeat protein